MWIEQLNAYRDQTMYPLAAACEMQVFDRVDASIRGWAMEHTDLIPALDNFEDSELWLALEATVAQAAFPFT